MTFDDSENLLRSNFNELTFFERGRQFLRSSNANAKFSMNILEKLQSFVRTNVLDLETLRFALDVIADCNETALSLAVNLLLDDFLLHSDQNCLIRSILLKRTFSIFDQLLRRLVGEDDLPDMEVFEDAITADMIERLTKLKGKYSKSEL